MKKLFTILVLLGIFITESYAHNSKQAFYSIEVKNGLTEVKVEFPWTIRKALLEFRPSLENAKNKEDFENALFDYIKTFLVLENPHGQPLELIQVTEEKVNGHTHQSNYHLTFKGSGLLSIQNRMMFNISDKQVNHHAILANGKTLRATTQKGKPSFILENIPVTKPLSKNLFPILVVLSVPLLFFFFKPPKKRRLF